MMDFTDKLIQIAKETVEESYSCDSSVSSFSLLSGDAISSISMQSCEVKLNAIIGRTNNEGVEEKYHLLISVFLYLDSENGWHVYVIKSTD